VQFGWALNALNVEILCANSSQAKGRVERSNRTLQDRLVKELRLAGISDMDAANAFLPSFTDRYNVKITSSLQRSRAALTTCIGPWTSNPIDCEMCSRSKTNVSSGLNLRSPMNANASFLPRMK
jgi:hypothetical protein